ISWQRWNVHLRASHLVALADQLGATQVVPLFTPFSDNALNAWYGLLSDRLCTAQRFSAHSRSVTLSCLESFVCPQ
ncbi:MAG: MBL fold metallo-hydrolase, partial [Halomonas sp.]